MRFLFVSILAALTVLSAIVWHVNPLHVITFVALGGLITSSTEFLLQYNVVDWLKDHILSLFGFFQSYSHAKIATLEARAAKIGTKVKVEEQRIEARLRAVAARMGVGRR